jgi:DNA-binding transcriptional ArsR family regulator
MPIRRTNSAQLFAALGDETRLDLISRLCTRGPLSITDLAAGSRVTRQGITKHLRVMERSGLAHATRRGRESVWEVDRRRVQEAQRYLEQISTQWDKALARLKAFVE